MDRLGGGGHLLVCSLSVQAACGAVYSVVPLVQRRMTGQIAGMVGAYGNVGSVIFLTLLTFYRRIYSSLY